MRFGLFCLMLIGLSHNTYAKVTFNNIKNRTIVQFELTDIMIDLSIENEIDLLDTWKVLSPNSFKKLNFTQAYLKAGDRMIALQETNKATTLYIKAYQTIDKEKSLKVEAAYKASFYLYAQRQRSEALFYIDRSIDELKRCRKNHPLTKDIHSLKRRIVWRYFSRLENLPDNAISAISFDGDDVWIGMWSGGVGRFSRSQARLDLFNVRNAKLPSNYIRDILVFPDKIWIATHCGLAYYRKHDSTWHRVEALKNYKLKTISHDGTYFYVATLFRGVFRSQDGIVWDNIIPRQSVLGVLHNKDSLFIATPEQGVFVYRDNQLIPFLPNISAKIIIFDSNTNHLWVGTYGSGLLKVDAQTGQILAEFRKNIVKSDYIESLLLIDNQLWIGTLDSGVAIYNTKQKKWSHLTLTDGLPGLDITAITQEFNHLWFGTLAGGIGIYTFR